MKENIILIGGYSKVRFLAPSIIKEGYHVTAINDDIEKCQSLALIDKLIVIHGDGSNPLVLGEAGALNAEVAIALTDKDADNLVICELCKEKFHVKKTASLVYDPEKINFFKRMGVDSVVCSVTAIASFIEQHRFYNEMVTMVPVGEGHICIVQTTITGTAPAVDKKLWEIDLPEDVIVGCIFRGEKSLIPRGDTRILAGDIVVMITTDENKAAALRELTEN